MLQVIMLLLSLCFLTGHSHGQPVSNTNLQINAPINKTQTNAIAVVPVDPDATNTIVTIDGTTYHHAKVVLVGTDGLSFKYISALGSNSLAYISLTNLPLDYQQKYGAIIQDNAKDKIHEEQLRVFLTKVQAEKEILEKAQAEKQRHEEEQRQAEADKAAHRSQPRDRVSILKAIVASYHKTHTYIGKQNGAVDDIYVCGDMACDVWNMVQTAGINVKIQVGNVDKDIKSLREANHVWVLAEESPGNWLALETTGGNVVYKTENERYYWGWSFETPKKFRDYQILRRFGRVP